MIADLLLAALAGYGIATYGWALVYLKAFDEALWEDLFDADWPASWWLFLVVLLPWWLAKGLEDVEPPSAGDEEVSES